MAIGENEKVWANPGGDIAADKNPAAVALGRLGGRKGGPARAIRLSAERRSEIARNAAQARWHGIQEAKPEVSDE